MKNIWKVLFAVVVLLAGACVKTDMELPVTTAEGRGDDHSKGNFLMAEERIGFMSDISSVKHFYKDGRLVKAHSPEGPIVFFEYDPRKRTVTATYTTSEELPYAKEIFYFNHHNRVIRSELIQLSGSVSRTSYGYQDDLVNEVTTDVDKGNGMRLRSSQKSEIRNGIVASILSKEETYKNNILIDTKSSNVHNRCTNPFRIELYDESGRLFNVKVFSPQVKSPTYNLWIYPNVDLSKLNIPRPLFINDNGERIPLLNWYMHGMLQVEDTYIYPDGRINYWRSADIRVNTDQQPLSFIQRVKGYDRPDTLTLRFEYRYVRL